MNLLGKLTKKQAFILILVILGVTSALASIFTKFTFIMRDDANVVHIAVVGPMTGPQALIGQSLKQGVELLAAAVNDGGGIGDALVKVTAYDDAGDPAKAGGIAAEIADKLPTTVVIGHWGTETAAAAGQVYKQRRLPVLTPAPLSEQVVAGNQWHFTTLFSAQQQSAFMANYARNVMGHKLVSVIQDGPAFADSIVKPFEATYRRFGTAIRQTWTFDGAAKDREALDAELDAIAAEVKARKDAGTIFLAVGARDGARLLKTMSDLGVRNAFIAPVALSTAAFNADVAKQAPFNVEPGRYTNRMMVAAPLLFDTANETAQKFKTDYQNRFKQVPDWVAAYAYDAAGIAVRAVRAVAKKQTDLTADIAANRGGVREFLASLKTSDDAVQGLSGRTFFDAEGRARKPVLVGTYNGSDIISALTQLQPIREGGTANYIEELKRGRVLYVNDRFMYKTNVVYTGIQVTEISNINVKKNTADLELMAWFRYRGNFLPQDLELTNANQVIKLDKPDDEQQVRDMTYRLYRLKGTFNMNFSDTRAAYGNALLGVTFSHRTLNRNNLLYVVDVLGLGINRGGTVFEQLNKAKALNPASGWVLDRAWISQDVAEKSTRGNPTYVGHGSTDPDFSKIDYGIVVKPAEINARDFVPGEYFIYIGIFGLLGTLFAFAMDRKEKGRFWTAQSWLLRLICWPFLLLAAGNIGLDLAIQTLETHIIDKLVLIYDCLWWILPARIAGIGMERFLWVPLEDHTGRNIPNVVRVFASVTIYSLASFGIIAFVFNEALTSLLATGGLLSLIVGLAVQSNISNIFSGIVINMERPFNVGDWVQIGEMDEGRVVDITWRTTRVKVRNGYVISIPNAQASEAMIHNFDSFDIIRLELAVHLDASHPPEEVQMVMMGGLEQAENVLAAPEREVRFKGVNWDFGWIAEYEVQFWIDNYGGREQIAEGVLEKVYSALRRHNMSPMNRPINGSGRPEIETGGPPQLAGEPG